MKPRIFASALSLLAALAGTAVAAPTRADLDNRLASVVALTAALGRIGGHDPAAREASTRASALMASAKAAMDAGENDRARVLLDEAYQLAKSAVDASVRARPVDERNKVVREPTADTAFKARKQRQDLAQKLASVAALRDALSRVAEEKGMSERHRPMIAHIDALLKEAGSEAGDLERALAAADEAYLNAKVGIESLRRGDVLVRSLHFADKKEEYAYEIDRNDAHLMLVQLLLEERRDDPRVQQFVARARTLRKEAEDLAGKADHAQAVSRMEDATKELQKAIRNAGVMIPG